VSKTAHELNELDKKIIENKWGASIWTILTALNVFIVVNSAYHMFISSLYGNGAWGTYPISVLVGLYVIWDWYRHFKWLFPKWRIWIKRKIYKIYRRLDK
jgi:hypothetical protein